MNEHNVLVLTLPLLLPCLFLRCGTEFLKYVLENAQTLYFRTSKSVKVTWPYLNKVQLAFDALTGDVHFPVLIHPALTTQYIVNTGGHLLPLVLLFVPVEQQCIGQ